MKLGTNLFARLGGPLALTCMLLTATLAVAQDDDGSAAIGALFGGIFLIIFLAIFAAGYVYVALALMTIAKKTNTPNGWMAWIPIANAILMLQIAKKPIWWIILLLFLPIINIVFIILIWMGIAEARNKPSWWGIMVIVPIMNIIMPGYLAWSADEPPQAAAAAR